MVFSESVRLARRIRKGPTFLLTNKYNNNNELIKSQRTLEVNVKQKIYRILDTQQIMLIRWH